VLCLDCYLQVGVGERVAQCDATSGDWAMARGLGERLGLSLFYRCLEHETRGGDSLIFVDVKYIFIVERLLLRI
jgi:hypothetical protein